MGFMHAVSDVSGIALDVAVCLGAEIDFAQFFCGYGVDHAEIIGGDMMKPVWGELDERQHQLAIAQGTVELGMLMNFLRFLCVLFVDRGVSS